MRALLAVALLVALALAGCTQEGATLDAGSFVDESEFEGVEATATTGVIRGVVVDEAVRPIAGAAITLAGDDPREATSSEAGAFAFAGLEPGTYFLTTTKIGYSSVQTSVDVVAGVQEPPITKVLLVADPTSTPFVTSATLDGFIECSVRTPAIGYALCEGIGNDNVVHDLALDGVPTFAQGELVWDSTQALGDELSFNWRKTGTDTDYIDTEGPSPLLLQANNTLLAKNDVGTEQPLRSVIFSGHNPLTEPPGGILWGVGVQFQQKFTIYLHVFYNFEPQPDWRFTANGPPEVPPQ